MSQNLPLPVSFAVVPTEELKLKYDDTTTASITTDSSGNLNLSADSDLTYNQGSLKSDGWIRNTEILSSTSAMSITLDTTFNSVNSSFTATLGIPNDNQIKNVQLYGKYCNPVNVDCTSSGGGTFTLSPSDSFKTLKYYGSCWNILPLSPSSPDSFYPTIQQGDKLTGPVTTGVAQLGQSVSLSKDGNTVAIGMPGIESVVIYVRTNGVWTQQGNLLTGSSNTTASFGSAAALSADGNTLAVGGYQDNSNQGAIWIFTRSGTTWSQQGSKLVGTGNTGAANQGTSIAISSNGNTVAVGAPSDNSSVGAVWIYNRTGSTWIQRGSKLVGTGNTGAAQLGQSVALSSDGNTLISGGYLDNSSVGAAWVFTQSNNVWTQQGTKLVGTGNTGNSAQGQSVALSADGNLAAIGGLLDNTNVGATWIFTRSNNVWAQQGSKLVGTGNTGGSTQGTSVSLTSDGNTLSVGGPQDNSAVGAVWVFTRVNNNWIQKGNKLISSDYTGASQQGGRVSLSGNGTAMVFGGAADNTDAGAVWVYI